MADSSLLPAYATQLIRKFQTVYAFLKVVLCRAGILNSNKLPWYMTEPPETYLTPETRHWFAQYARLNDDQVVPHITNIQNRAWAVRQYPCIGQFAFLRSQLKLLPEYPVILSKLQEPEAIYLDIGVCLGMDIRTLIADGIPSRNLYGLDIIPDFWKLGYDLFNDQDTIDSKFLHVDLLSPDDEKNDEMNHLYGRCDVIHATSFFHLFDEPMQKKAIQQVVRLSKIGTIVAGLHIGQPEPGVVHLKDRPQLLHNPESWCKFWNEAVKVTGTSWQIHAFWREWDSLEKESYVWMGGQRRLIKWFAVRNS